MPKHNTLGMVMEKKNWIDPKLVEVGKVSEAAAPSSIA